MKLVRPVTLAPLLIAVLLSPFEVRAQDPCPAASTADAEAGWAAYQQNDMAAARIRFDAALARCDNDQYSRTGLGYVELREGNTAQADTLFSVVVGAEPNNVDGLVGLGLVKWRTGDLAAVRDHFVLVLELSPDHPTAIEYLERVSGQVLGVAPDRGALVLPGELVYPARTAGDRFEVRTQEGWTPFYIKGVNLGAALPGKHPSEFPDSMTYARWIRGMADMNANAVRVYTVHPPAFYDALHDWNVQNPDRLLWLIHGVWTELPPDDDYGAAAFEREFFSEMHNVVDLLHGRADIEARPGHAFGYYTSDVSPWTLAYIIGREWEPFSAMAYDSIRGGESGFSGQYVTLSGGNALDAWMARAIEEIVAYETETYRAQRPVAYTNWPTLDPLAHPTEPTVDEEMAIRRALGETPNLRIREYDNDGISLDAALVAATDRLPAGYFASFHAYPYYPDFMLLQDDYQSSSSGLGRSNYFGYLRSLKEHHPGMPVVISEYGVPASLGVGHLQPQGWHHGGLTEAEMSAINRRLTLELAEAGMAGGAIFAWMDEWFKKNWVTTEFELPADRNRLWYNRLDAEQHYGLWAMEASSPIPGGTFEERRASWSGVPALYEADGITVRATHDEAYLWLYVESPGLAPTDTIMVGFDVIYPAEGDFSWPGRAGGPVPVGLEFALEAVGESVRVMADPPSNPFKHVEVGQGASGLTGVAVPISYPPEGFFYAREEQRLNLPNYTRANDDGLYDSLRVIVNRRRFARDSTEYLGIGYDRGILPRGESPDGFWERTADGVLEVRIPWLLINVTDPSSRTVLQGPGTDNAWSADLGPDGRWRLKSGVLAWPDTLVGELGVEQIEGIGIVATVLDGTSTPRSAPVAGGSVAYYEWPMWEAPRYIERARPTYYQMRDVYRTLNPYSGIPSVPSQVPEPPPSQSDEADVAWRAGDTDRAFELYEARLASNPNDGAALHRVALMRAWIEEYDESLEMFDRLLTVESGNLDARVDRARVRAWRGDTDQALSELSELLAAHPDHSGALEARALFEAWAGRYEESISSYEELLSISPDNGAARRQQAQVMSWASDFEGSQTAYEALLAQNPNDVDARIGLARTFAFSDELDLAIAEYDRILEGDPGNLVALQGKGRTLAWADRLIEGEEVLRLAVALDETNADSYVGLGQILQWQGRNAAAQGVLERAVAISPTNGDVREQLRTVGLALAPRGQPTAVYESDSDGNRMFTTSLAASWHPAARFEIRADAYRRRLEQNALEREAFGGTMTGVLELEPGWTLTAGLGGSLTDAAGDPTYLTYRGGVRSPGRQKFSVGLDVSSQALDETAALADRGVQYTSYGANLRLTRLAGWRIDGNAGYAVFDGSEENERVSGSLAVSRRLGRFFSLGASFRAFEYEKDLDDGYFDPDFYGVGEMTSYWRYSPVPWSFLVEAAPGVQQVTKAGSKSFSFRGSGRLGYLIGQGRELSLSFGYSSAGLLSFSTGSSDYRYTALILGLNWVF